MIPRNPIRSCRATSSVAAVWAALALSLGTASAETTLLTAAFDTLSDGAVTEANLDGVTTGGTWSFNADRGATFTASTATGPDVAINFDDSSVDIANTYIPFATLSLDSAATLSDTSSITLTTRAAVGRADGKASTATPAGTDRVITYLLQDSAGNDLINLAFWYTGVADVPPVDDSFLVVNGGSANALGVDFQFGPDNWLDHNLDPTKAGTVAVDVELTLYASTFDITFGSYTATGLSYANSGNGTLGSLELGSHTVGAAATAPVGGYLDDLTITQAAEFRVAITPNPGNPGNYDFSWTSRTGMVYDLVSATDLATPVSSWAVWDSQSDLAANPPTNTLNNIPGGGDTKRFFAVVEKPAP